MTHKATHKYINKVSRSEISGLKNKKLLHEGYFSAKTMSYSYATRKIIDYLNEERKKIGLSEIYFKLASDSPRNAINKADKNESHLLKLMNERKIVKYKKIIADNNDNKFLYVAMPAKRITHDCLTCHGEPSDAPKEMKEQYPGAKGYFEKVGDIRAILSIRIPLKRHIEDGIKYANIYTLITFLVLISIYIIIAYFIFRIDRQQQIILKKNIELESMASHDMLTGLPNRRFFESYAESRIKQAERKNEKLAFLYIDLNGFKAVNDTLSHKKGDVVLKSISQKFIKFIRKDELIARIGGDEFCMIIYNYKDKNELEQAAKRLVSNCSERIQDNKIDLMIGMSIGISAYPEDGKTYDQLISVADNAMYKIKHSNK